MPENNEIVTNKSWLARRLLLVVPMVRLVIALLAWNELLPGQNSIAGTHLMQWNDSSIPPANDAESTLSKVVKAMEKVGWKPQHDWEFGYRDYVNQFERGSN